MHNRGHEPLARQRYALHAIDPTPNRPMSKQIPPAFSPKTISITAPVKIASYLLSFLLCVGTLV